MIKIKIVWWLINTPTPFIPPTHTYGLITLTQNITQVIWIFWEKMQLMLECGHLLQEGLNMVQRENPAWHLHTSTAVQSSLQQWQRSACKDLLAWFLSPFCIKAKTSRNISKYKEKKITWLWGTTVLLFQSKAVARWKRVMKALAQDKGDTTDLNRLTRHKWEQWGNLVGRAGDTWGGGSDLIRVKG